MHTNPLGLLAGVATLAAGLPTASADETGGDPSQAVAVIELFTSQGCSSCPPADALLAKLDDLADARGLPLYTLSMHVDYWNRLGWDDPYSDASFTSRQREYAAAVGSRGVYTPQMIVNGSQEFVGSDGAKAQRAVSQALSRPAPATLALTATSQPDGESVRVSYRVDGAAPGSDVVVCLVRDTEPNAVPRGENAGRRLQHRGVVRSLRVTPLDPNGRGTAVLPVSGAKTGLEVVAFVQQRASRQIDGAARSVLTTADARR